MAAKKNDVQEELLNALGVESLEEALKKVNDSKMASATATPYPVAVEDANMTTRVIVNIPVNPMNPLDPDVTVGLNGKFWKIKRGEDVEVPLAVAEILKSSSHQKAAAIKFAASVSSNS